MVGNFLGERRGILKREEMALMEFLKIKVCEPALEKRHVPVIEKVKLCRVEEHTLLIDGVVLAHVPVLRANISCLGGSGLVHASLSLTIKDKLDPAAVFTSPQPLLQPCLHDAFIKCLEEPPAPEILLSFLHCVPSEFLGHGVFDKGVETVDHSVGEKVAKGEHSTLNGGVEGNEMERNWG